MAYFECTIGGSGDGSTLTVTCYSGFAGLTISITNGVDTFSDVCPSTSPYEVEFDGLADGTWTVSTVYGGQTYTKTVEINTSTIFNPIPNGATATPINNIQTWLHCADIWNKNYTTIAQVLADASTLQALIASNNAVDYMARSTDWASDSNVGLVPAMTSNTTPYGTVYALTENYGASGREGWKAFDGNDNTAWWGAFQNNTTYVQYDFGKTIQLAKCIGKCGPGISDASTFKVIFEYSIDNTNWYAFGDEITKGGTGLFDISANNGGNTVSARYVRFRTISSTAGNIGVYTPTLQFYPKAGIPNNQNAMIYIGNNNYCANKLLANNTWLNAICNSLYFESVLNTKVPTMTSYTTPSGVVSAKDEYSGWAAWLAFGGTHDTGRGWVANSAPSWIQYQFTTPVCVNKIYVWNPAGSNRPWTGTLQGSNDGTTFTDIQSNIDGSQGVDGYTNITNNTKYKYYRMVASGTAAFIGALQFYGRA